MSDYLAIQGERTSKWAANLSLKAYQSSAVSGWRYSDEDKVLIGPVNGPFCNTNMRLSDIFLKIQDYVRLCMEII
jgi:hypothetical protein